MQRSRMSDPKFLNALPFAIGFRRDRRTDGSCCWLAFHPELPGCMAEGETLKEAIDNLDDARQLYIESMVEDGLDVPLPKPLVTFEMSVDTKSLCSSRSQQWIEPLPGLPALDASVEESLLACV